MNTATTMVIKPCNCVTISQQKFGFPKSSGFYSSYLKMMNVSGEVKEEIQGEKLCAC
jgi:hypothetical protein